MRVSSLMVIQYVYEMSRAVAFYRDALGLQVISESSGWSMLSCGDALVGLHAIGPGVSEGLARHAGLNLRVDDLEAAVADISRAGGRLIKVREAEPPLVPVRLAEVQDPEGNVFELREYVGSS
jgi:predicted enzyme related to lactoylglutathione lyase